MVDFTPLGTGFLSITAPLAGVRERFDTASTQLATGLVAQTYGGLGLQRGLDITSRARLTEIEGYQETINFISVQFELYDATLQRMNDLNGEVKIGADPNVYNVNSDGRTTGSITAEMALREIMGLLNIDDGGSYLFAGRETQTQPLANYNEIMYGTATRAGFQEVLAERKAADLGADVAVTHDGETLEFKTGRLSVGRTGAALTLSETTNDFGFQLAGVQTTIGSTITTTLPTAASFTPPAVAHDELSIDFNGTPFAHGDEIDFSFDLPDGTQTTITLMATDPGRRPLDGDIGGTDADQSATDIVEFTETQLPVPGLPEIGEITAADIALMTDGDTIDVTDPDVNGGVAQTFTFATGADGSDGATFDDVASLITAMTTAGLDAQNSAGDVEITSAEEGGALTFALSTGGYTQTQAPVAPISQEITLAAADIAEFSDGETITLTDPNVDGGRPQVFRYIPGTDGTIANQFSDINSLVTAMTTVGFDASNVGGDLVVASVRGNTTLTSSVQTIVEDLQPDGYFLIDPAGSAATVENIETALLARLNESARTELSAASAHRASRDFFFASDADEQAPSRVVIPTGGRAEDALESTTDTINTVQWYVADLSDSLDPRDSFTASIDPNITLKYGSRANEAAISGLIRNMAVLTMETFDATVDFDQARYAELATRARIDLVDEPGEQSINQIQAEFAVMYSSIQQSEARLRISENTYLTFIEDIEGVDKTEVAARVVALETQLNASYQAASTLLNTSLLNYL